MPETTLVTATPFEESKTISLGNVTDFTIDLSHAQRWVCTMTGDGTLTVTQPVKYVNQEITLLIKTSAARVLTLPAGSYDESGPLATLTVLPTTLVGTGGHVLRCITTVDGFFWETSSAASALDLRVLVHDIVGAGLAKGTIVYLDGGLTSGVWDARAYTPVGVTHFPLGVVETAIAAGANGFVSRQATLSGLANKVTVAANDLIACIAAGDWDVLANAPAAANNIFPGVVGRCTAKAGTTTIKFDFTSFQSHKHGTDALQNLAVATGKIADLAVTTGKIADSAVTDAKVGSKILKDIGSPGVASLMVSGVSVAAETIVLGSQTYTFATPHVPGDLNIDPDGATGGGNAAQTLAAIVATVNANAGREFNAVEVGGDAVAFVERAVGGVELDTTTTMLNGAFSHTKSVGFETAAVVSRSSGVYRVRANDVMAWAAGDEIAIGGIASTTQPTLFKVQARASYDPAVAVAYRSVATLVARIVQVNAGYWILLIQDPGAVLVADDGLVYGIEI